MPIEITPTGGGVELPPEDIQDISKARDEIRATEFDGMINQFATVIKRRTPTTSTDSDYGSPESGSYAEQELSCVWQPISADEVIQDTTGILKAGDVYAFIKGGQIMLATDVILKSEEEWQVMAIHKWELLSDTMYKRLTLRRMDG